MLRVCRNQVDMALSIEGDCICQWFDLVRCSSGALGAADARSHVKEDGCSKDICNS